MTGNEWLHDWHLPLWVPWLISIGNVTSLWLTGDLKRSGFTVLIVTIVLVYVPYAVLTDQLGFLLQNLVMTAVAVIKWHKWGAVRQGPAPQDPLPDGAECKH